MDVSISGVRRLARKVFGVQDIWAPARANICSLYVEKVGARYLV